MAVSGGGFAQRLQQAWLSRGPLALALWPLSLVFRGLVAIRCWCFSVGLLQTQVVSALVVVVGNVVVGGAGKTPVVLELARHLRRRGVQVGVVSRGFGSSGLACLEVQADMAAEQCGDEPLLLKRALDMPVFVGAKRALSARALLVRYPDVKLILCDDGLQHLALARDIEICLFDERGSGNGWLLPAGPLREKWPKKVDFVLSPIPSNEPGCYALMRSLADHAVRSDGTTLPLTALHGRRLNALAAIARPEAFFSMLQARGLTLEQTFAMPDHDDLQGWTPPADPAVQLVFTEKDAVKLWPRVPNAIAVPLSITLDPSFVRAFDAMVDAGLSSLPRTKTDVMHG